MQHFYYKNFLTVESISKYMPLILANRDSINVHLKALP